MTEEQREKARLIIDDLIKKHKSLRSLAKIIDEDSSDLCKWRLGKGKIGSGAVVKIARLFGIDPSSLRPDIFPKDTTLTFKMEK